MMVTVTLVTVPWPATTMFDGYGVAVPLVPLAGMTIVVELVKLTGVQLGVAVGVAVAVAVAVAVGVGVNVAVAVGVAVTVGVGVGVAHTTTRKAMSLRLPVPVFPMNVLAPVMGLIV